MERVKSERGGCIAETQSFDGDCVKKKKKKKVIHFWWGGGP